MADHEHLVYILKCKDNTFYTGYTNNLNRRLHLHESGKGAKYTRGRGPFEVVYTQGHSTKEEALRREYAIKQLKRIGKQVLIETYLRESDSDANSKKF